MGEAYRRASPASYVHAVRSPVLIIAATADVKCPPAQIRTYSAALRARGVSTQVEWTRSGHDGYDVDLHVQSLGTVIYFLGSALGGKHAAAAAGAG